MTVPIPALQGRGMTMSDQLARHARKNPHAAALRFEGTGRSYAELDERVTRLARALRQRGVASGDRVAVLALNGMETWEAYLAGVRLGAIVVPVNFRLVADEVAYVLSDSGAVALVVDTAMAEVGATAREQAPSVISTLVIGGDYEEALATAGTEPLDVVVDEGEPAFIMSPPGRPAAPRARCSPTGTCSCTPSARSPPSAGTPPTGSGSPAHPCSTSPAWPGACHHCCWAART